MHRFTAGKRDCGGPERIIRRRNQHFITAVQQGLHGLDDKLGNAVTDIDVFDRHIAHTAGLIVLHDGLTRGIKTF